MIFLCIHERSNLVAYGTFKIVIDIVEDENDVTE